MNILGGKKKQKTKKKNIFCAQQILKFMTSVQSGHFDYSPLTPKKHSYITSQ